MRPKASGKTQRRVLAIKLARLAMDRVTVRDRVVAKLAKLARDRVAAKLARLARDRVAPKLAMLARDWVAAKLAWDFSGLSRCLWPQE